MPLYSWISVTALLCYLMIMLTFLSMARGNKVIRAFITLMGAMIVWAGGSVGMRLGLPPSLLFWHQVSVFGILLAPGGYYYFFLSVLEVKQNYRKCLWLAISIVFFLLNCFTNRIVPEPTVVVTASGARFGYHYTPYFYLLYFFAFACCIDIGWVLYRHCRGNRVVLRQLMPIIVGVVILFGGHILAVLPPFYGVPFYMIAGIINAGCIFYSLYQRKILRLETLYSKAGGITISAVVVLTLGLQTFEPAQEFAAERFGLELAQATALVTGCLALLVPVCYMLVKSISRLVLKRGRERRNARIAKLAEDVGHMVGVAEVLKSVAETIQELTKAEKVAIFLLQSNGDYRVEYTDNPLDEKKFHIRADHPLITSLKDGRRFVVLRELRRTTAFRGTWEDEKAMLRTLEADVFVPMFAQNSLIALIMLPRRKERGEYSANDVNTVCRIAEVCAAPLKDVYYYERAIDEARRDKLTGLINRKYFFEVLARDFEHYKDSTLSLCLLNLDNFTAYNQLYGVREGDLALQRVAGLLTFGISEASTAARIGGKEFALILPGYDVHFAKLIAENLASEIGSIRGGKDGPNAGRLTVSAGICGAPNMASSAKELFQNAEATVYSVKRSGKNSVQLFSPDIYFREEPPSGFGGGYKENANTVHALIAAIDAKDHYTAQHSQNVAYYAEKLGRAAGLTSDLLEVLREAALLHDIGKIGIREDILNKPGKLTTKERAAIREHVENGVNIIRNLPSLDYVIPTVYAHHERYDGSGYPQGLKGEDIPILGRILCIADAFDAMTTRRCYHMPLTLAQAATVLRDESGKQFDPKLTLIFIRQLRDGMIRVLGRQERIEPVKTDAPEEPSAS